MKRTTKRTLKSLAILGLIVALLMSSVTALAAGGSISKKQAKSIALKQAGVKSSAVKKWVKVKLDNWDDDGDQEWDVEFKTKKYLFEVEINAVTGAVEDFDKEEIKTKISKDKAKAAALEKAGIKSSAVKKWIKVKLDGDEWDVEFKTESAKYEVEVDAYSAAILSYETEEIVRQAISEDKAKAAALKKAGVKSSAVKQWLKVQLEGDEWDVEFQTAKYRFEVEVNAYTGKVKDFEKKALPKEPIAEDKAKAAALKKAGVKEADVEKWLKVQLDEDEWDIEFQTAKYKFEVEINAFNGKVKDFEKKKLSSGTAAISLDDAKAIALDHARGRAELGGKVKYTKAKLDRDDGRLVYEIEFRCDGIEFEYEIDANSGDILDWDMDRDD